MSHFYVQNANCVLLYGDPTVPSTKTKRGTELSRPTYYLEFSIPKTGAFSSEPWAAEILAAGNAAGFGVDTKANVHDMGSHWKLTTSNLYAPVVGIIAARGAEENANVKIEPGDTVAVKFHAAVGTAASGKKVFLRADAVMLERKGERQSTIADLSGFAPSRSVPEFVRPEPPAPWEE